MKKHQRCYEFMVLVKEYDKARDIIYWHPAYNFADCIIEKAEKFSINFSKAMSDIGVDISLIDRYY